MGKVRDQSNTTTVISLRLTPGILRFIDEDLEDNEIHRTRTDWLQTAIDHYMKERLADMKLIRDLRGGGALIKFLSNLKKIAGTNASACARVG